MDIEAVRLLDKSKEYARVLKKDGTKELARFTDATEPGMRIMPAQGLQRIGFKITPLGYGSSRRRKGTLIIPFFAAKP